MRYFACYICARTICANDTESMFLKLEILQFLFIIVNNKKKLIVKKLGGGGRARPPWPHLGSYSPDHLMLMTEILVPSSNKLRICNFLVESRCIHRLERVLIARRLQFKKVTIMLKGHSPKFKGQCVIFQ